MQKTELEQKRLYAQVKMPLDYLKRSGASLPSCAIILLHGFAETGEKILTSLNNILPAEALILSANAPLPVPKKTKQGSWRAVFSWYFWQGEDKVYIVDREPALDLLCKMISDEKASAMKKIIIGFSQGGWMAPHLAMRLQNVTQIIAVGCENSLKDVPIERVKFRWDSVHAMDDEIVDFKTAQTNHHKLSAAGVPGEFIAIENSAHGLDEPVVGAIASLFQAQNSPFRP